MFTLPKRAIAKARRLAIVDRANLHAEHEIMHLKRLFQLLDIDFVIDVGANAGQYAKRLRDLVGYRGEILSVEPIPEMVELLLRESKGDPKWHVVNGVISDKSGPVSFNIMADLQCSSLAEPDNTETNQFSTQTSVDRIVTLQATTLDQLADKWVAERHFKRPFLKLDTQGRDLTIIKSCSTLRRFVAFQSELSVKRLYKGTPSFSEVISEYCSLGYDLSALVPNNGIGFPYLIEVDCIMIRRS